MDVHRKIQAYFGSDADENHRFRSWEYCYGYFRSTGRDRLVLDREHAALQLAFYLASWGMYRGSSFLLQHAYTVHHGVINLIAQDRFSGLWCVDFGAEETDVRHIAIILELIEGIRAAYRPYAPRTNSGQPTDTLITKIILGTFGCLPARDDYFKSGLKGTGLVVGSLNRPFIERIHRFSRKNLRSFRKEQTDIERKSGVRYPLMKLVDMYFWQLGRENAGR